MAPSLVSSKAGLGFNWAKAASFCNSVSTRIRSTAMASTVAMENRKCTSSSVNVRGRLVYAPSTPNACSWPAMATVTPLTTLWLVSNDDPRNRPSLPSEANATASFAVRANPVSVCGSAGMTTFPTSPSFQPTPARIRRNLPPG